MEMWKVIIIQGENRIQAAFNHMADAIQYVSTTLECGDDGTEVLIKIEEE